MKFKLPPLMEAPPARRTHVFCLILVGLSAFSNWYQGATAPALMWWIQFFFNSPLLWALGVAFGFNLAQLMKRAARPFFRIKIMIDDVVVFDALAPPTADGLGVRLNSATHEATFARPDATPSEFRPRTPSPN